MTCRAELVATHRGLERALAGVEAVHTLTYLPPGDTDPYPRTELLVDKTIRGTAPETVERTIADSGAGIAGVQPANDPDLLAVTVR